MKKQRKRNAKGVGYRILSALTALFVTLSFLFTFLMISDGVTERDARTLPPYAKEEILPTLLKGEWTEEDYDFLYRQTGLGRQALTALKGNSSRILRFQEALFYDGEITHIEAAPTTPHEIMLGYTAPLAPIEDGDVFVTSTCHTYGWRNGHAAVVTDSRNQMLLQSIGPGVKSCEEGPSWFLNSANFMVLRLKGVSKEERAEIARHAREHYLNIPYSLTVGIFSPKDQGDNLKATNCSHLVWQAFKAKGYDLDADGGIATSRDIATSPLFEVVQVYGFNPLTLWN